MEDFVKLIQFLEEYTEDVYPDFDRLTVMIKITKKYLQDIMLRMDNLPYDIIYKDEMDGEIFLVFYVLSFDEEDEDTES